MNKIPKVPTVQVPEDRDLGCAEVSSGSRLAVNFEILAGYHLAEFIPHLHLHDFSFLFLFFSFFLFYFFSIKS